MSAFVNDVRKEVKRISDSIESKVALFTRCSMPLQVPDIVVERAVEVSVFLKAFEQEHFFHTKDQFNEMIAIEMMNIAILDNLFIPEDVLLSKEKINPKQHAEIKNHPNKAFILAAQIHLGIRITTIIGAHHERIDKNGFPRGKVPLVWAQVYNAIRDVSAMISDREYRSKQPFSIQEACEIKSRDSGFVNPVVMGGYVWWMPYLYEKYIH